MGLFMLSAVAYGQGTSKYITAYNYYRDGDYLRAKEYIDKAMEYEDAREKAKTWMTKGDIYSRLAYPKDGEDYGISPVEAAIIATESYTTAKGMDTRRIDENRLNLNLSQYSNVVFSLGVSAYNERAYDLALRCFTVTTKGKEAIGEIDSLAIYNMGLCNENLERYSEAIANYKGCIAIGYSSELCYQNISYLQRLQGDDAAALATVNEGLLTHPGNRDLLTSKVNLLLALNRHSEAIEYLNPLIAADPDNAILVYARGTCHNSEGSTNAAINDFKKAIEIEPDYFDAVYNLGAAYYNLGADIVNEANDLSDPALYEAKKGEADEYFELARVQLERAHELDARNVAVMRSLLEIYARNNDMEKYKEMKARMDN